MGKGYWNVILLPIRRCANRLSLGIVSRIYSHARRSSWRLKALPLVASHFYGWLKSLGLCLLYFTRVGDESHIHATCNTRVPTNLQRSDTISRRLIIESPLVSVESIWSGDLQSLSSVAMRDYCKLKTLWYSITSRTLSVFYPIYLVYNCLFLITFF